MNITHFDPFKNRLCHDIRNGLSDAFMDALVELSSTPYQREADTLLQTYNLPEVCQQYIMSRLLKYNIILSKLRQTGITDTIPRAIELWNQELFFEVHDLLEKDWLVATGTKKEILQALIRAAGMYIHLDHGNTTGAGKMAAKAHAALVRHQKSIPQIKNIALLLQKLASIDKQPPLL